MSFFSPYYSYVIVQGCILGSILNFPPQQQQLSADIDLHLRCR